MKQVKNFFINSLLVGGNKMTFIAGPCAIESREMCEEVASELVDICQKLDINYIFKGSYDKANRSNVNAGRGVGMSKGLEILEDIKNKYDIPVTTDVHETWQCEEVGKVVDLLQIPAYLCRQTDLLMAAAKTGRAVNIKKGQFMAPWNMNNIVKKIQSCDNEKILLCERGTSFGYNRLVVDMQGLVDMREFGYPVILDATHSVQQPGSNDAFTGGNRDFVPYLIKAGLAVGVDGIFAEVHPNPEEAISDGPSQLRLDDVEHILSEAIEYDKLTRRL